MDEDVQVQDNEDFNKVVDSWGPSIIRDIPYWDILEKKLDAVDMKRGTKITGHRGYFLKGVGVRLALALTQYGMNFLEK